MILTVDPSSAVPPYEQIRSQIEAMVATGTLAPGDRLPSIRQLAHDLGLAGGTVARAYTELEQAGLVVSRRRTGTVVADGVAAPAAERRRRLAEAAEQYARTAALLGVAVDDAQDAVRRALRAT
ncbi:MAG: GntR family transcriptional regulator [Candidatus Nanopelagicales bacterium]